MKTFFRRTASIGIGALASSLPLLLLGVATSDGYAGRVLTDRDQAQIRGGALGFGESCTGTLTCGACTGPTCVAGRNNVCQVKTPSSGNCSLSATISVCVAASWYNWCRLSGTGLCGSSVVGNACPQVSGCPSPNPLCVPGGNFGCGGC